MSIVVDILSSQIVNIIVGGGFIAIFAYQLNTKLQEKLLKQKNKDDIIDELIVLLGEQRKIYVNHWGGSENTSSLTTTNEAFLQTKVDALLGFAESKYPFENIEEIENGFRNLCKLSTGGNFNPPENKKNLRKCRQINDQANELHINILTNKI